MVTGRYVEDMYKVHSKCTQDALKVPLLHAQAQSEKLCKWFAKICVTSTCSEMIAACSLSHAAVRPENLCFAKQGRKVNAVISGKT